MSVRVPVWAPSFDDVMAGRPPSAAEEALLAACRTNGWAWVGDDRPEDTSDPERAVRAGLIRFLLLGGDERHRPHPAGVRIRGAWIEAALDFQGCETHLDLVLVRCFLPKRPVFRDAQIGALYLTGSRAASGCELQRLKVETNIFLNAGFHATGTVDLAGAAIPGQLACKGGRFERPEGMALNVNAATIGADVFLNDGFHATGEVNLGGTAITGQLACSGGRFDRPEGVALNANAATVGADVFLRDGFYATGEVNLVGAAITGQLACDGGRFERPEGVALNANAATVGADVFLRDGFHATGEVNLAGAAITGQLACDGGRYERPDGVALDANAASIGASVFLRDGFHAAGEVNLTGAAITGQLACSGGRFERPEGVALDADASSIGADVFLCDRILVEGGVNLTRARIEGNLRVQRAQIEGEVVLHSARVADGFFWQEVNGAIPGMDLTEAKVGALHDDVQSWACVKDRLKLDGFQYEVLHSAMTISERLALLNRNDKPPFRVLPAGLAEAAPWLPTTDKRVFSPLPHTQLAKVLLAKGRRAEAAKVLFARERRLRKTEWLRARARVDGSWKMGFRSVGADLQRFGGLWFRWLYGYGLRPWRALFWAGGYWIAATFFFQAVYAAGEFAPNSDVVLTSAGWKQAAEFGCPLAGDEGFDDAKAAGCVMPQFVWSNGMKSIHPPIPAPPEGCPAGRTVEGLAACEVPRSTSAGDYETFSALLYAADLFLPLDTIGQTEAWAPSKDRGAWGAAGYWARFPIQMFGWIMVAMAASVLAGVIGKKEE